MERDFSPRALIAAVRRRRFSAIAAALAGLGAASVVSIVLPRSYLSEARVELSPRASLDPQEYAAQVAAIRERLLSAGGGESVTQVELAPGAGDVRVLHVRHTAATPDLACRAVDQLVAEFRGDLYDRPREAQGKDVELRRTALAEATARADEARKVLTAHEAANQDLLRPVDQDLASVRREIETIESQDLVQWKEKLQQAEQGLAAEPRTTRTENRRVDASQIASVEAEIRKARTKLSDLVGGRKYAEEHPEVVAQRRYVAELETQKTDLERNAPVEVQLTPNPLYEEWSRLRDEAKNALVVAEMRVAGLRKNERHLQEVKKQAPPVLAQQQRLAAAVKAEEEQVAARRLELEKSDEKLRTIDDERRLDVRVADAPKAPDTPAGPHVALFALGGLGLGAAAGLGIVVVADARDRSFRRADAAARFLGVPSIGAIGTIETPAESQAAGAALRRRAGVTLILGLAAAALAGAATWSWMRPAPEADSIGGR